MEYNCHRTSFWVRQSTSIPGCVCRLVSWSVGWVTHSFDDPHLAVLIPTCLPAQHLLPLHWFAPKKLKEKVSCNNFLCPQLLTVIIDTTYTWRGVSILKGSVSWRRERMDKSTRQTIHVSLICIVITLRRWGYLTDWMSWMLQVKKWQLPIYTCTNSVKCIPEVFTWNQMNLVQ